MVLTCWMPCGHGTSSSTSPVNDKGLSNPPFPKVAEKMRYGSRSVSWMKYLGSPSCIISLDCMATRAMRSTASLVFGDCIRSTTLSKSVVTGFLNSPPVVFTLAIFICLCFVFIMQRYKKYLIFPYFFMVSSAKNSTSWRRIRDFPTM